MAGFAESPCPCSDQCFGSSPSLSFLATGLATSLFWKNPGVQAVPGGPLVWLKKSDLQETVTDDPYTWI